MNTIDIGSKIKKLRSKKSIEIGKKYTGAMLANELGISRSYLGDIESGRTVPNEIILGKIADIFDVDIYELIGDDKDISIDNSNVIELKYSKKVTDTIRKIDDNSAIKRYIKDTDFNELIIRILDENSTPIVTMLKDNIEKLSEIEEEEFKEINNINKNDYSLESSTIKHKFISTSNKNILNKINSILTLEISKTATIIDLKNKYSNETIAAHAKPGASIEDIKHDDDIMNDDNFWNE
ncbi:helix-turn-helix transcriptional regulator [uncultured Clostridium sp.]|uniref:helix-turn-helix domain-containing protein n=1 Tax=uncultured Clostridium sp. TaxID=59620 RepID=UPI0025DA288A|nr:helix-turn-helix transcriptional regulator [uncultured Clostridium sp.]